jgi:hypothetical protein
LTRQLKTEPHPLRKTVKVYHDVEDPNYDLSSLNNEQLMQLPLSKRKPISTCLTHPFIVIPLKIRSLLEPSKPRAQAHLSSSTNKIILGSDQQTLLTNYINFYYVGTLYLGSSLS